MGCCFVIKNSRKNLPLLKFIYEEGNKKQKLYCLRFKDNFRYRESVRYIIKSSLDTNFSITLEIKDKKHQIQTIFSDDEMDKYLQKIYDLLDEVYIKDYNININKSFDINLYEEEANNLKQKVLENQEKFRNEQNIQQEIYTEGIININNEYILDKEKNEKINKVLNKKRNKRRKEKTS